jgi:hypothetical protein
LAQELTISVISGQLFNDTHLAPYFRATLLKKYLNKEDIEKDYIPYPRAWDRLAKICPTHGTADISISDRDFAQLHYGRLPGESFNRDKATALQVG